MSSTCAEELDGRLHQPPAQQVRRHPSELIHQTPFPPQGTFVVRDSFSCMIMLSFVFTNFIYRKCYLLVSAWIVTSRYIVLHLINVRLTSNNTGCVFIVYLKLLIEMERKKKIDFELSRKINDASQNSWIISHISEHCIIWLTISIQSRIGNRTCSFENSWIAFMSHEVLHWRESPDWAELPIPLWVLHHILIAIDFISVSMGYSRCSWHICVDHHDFIEDCNSLLYQSSSLSRYYYIISIYMKLRNKNIATIKVIISQFIGSI